MPTHTNDKIVFQDDRGVTILDQEIAANRYKMLVSGLAEAGARQHGINFIPSGPGVPTDGGEQGVRPGPDRDKLDKHLDWILVLV